MLSSNILAYSFELFRFLYFYFDLKIVEFTRHFVLISLVLQLYSVIVLNSLGNPYTRHLQLLDLAFILTFFTFFMIVISRAITVNTDIFYSNDAVEFFSPPFSFTCFTLLSPIHFFVYFSFFTNFTIHHLKILNVDSASIDTLHKINLQNSLKNIIWIFLLFFFDLV